MSLEAQRQIRENACEAQEFLKDLHKWQSDVKAEDRELKHRETGSHHPPPRKSTVTQTTTQKHCHREKMETKDSLNESKAEDLRIRGNSHFRDGDYSKAVDLYSESLDVHETCVR